MASLINFSGIASGIDSSALIKALLDSDRAVRVKPLQSKVTSFTDTNSSFSELKSLLGKLNTASQKLREVNGGALAKSASSSDETIVTASASGSATNGTYTLNVSQLAKNATFSFDDRFTSADAAINSDINDGLSSDQRIVQIQVGTGAEQEAIEIEVSSTTTLSDFAEQFNAASDKATASVINVGTAASPSYALSIISNNQGTDKGEIAVTVADEIKTAGLGAFNSSALSQATDATFTISGVTGTITKSSNSIADVIPGLTLNLQATGSATLSVSDDASSSSATVQEFVNAYNEVINYIAESDQITREEDSSGVTNIFGPLASTSVDESVVTSLRQALSSAGISGGSVNILADLGITTERDGTLKFDSAVFQDALASDPESVRQITSNLGETLGAVDGTLAQFTQFNGIIDIASNSNTEQITRLNDQIARIEDGLSAKEQSLLNQFARLESLIGQLNSQQNSLSQLL